MNQGEIMRRSRNIFLVGPLAAGKSTIGRLISEELNMDFYDTDKVIEQELGVDINWIFDLEGEEKFREREANVIKKMVERQGIVLATGGGAVVHPESRKLLGARGFVIYLKTSIDQQLERTRYCRKRPQIRGEDKRPVLNQMAENHGPYYEEIADYAFSIVSDGSVRSAVDQIMKDIEKMI